MSHIRYDVNQRPPLHKWLPLSLQHVFAMFGATVLVPLLTGLSISAALFASGCGTLIYILITGGKVPAYLGSSFAFIAPLAFIVESAGVPYAMGASLCVGIFYCLISILIRFTGTKWIDKAMPPIVIGSVIMVIGLNLAPVAMDMAMNKTHVTSSIEVVVENGVDGEISGVTELRKDNSEVLLNSEKYSDTFVVETKSTWKEYKIEYLIIALFTLMVAVICSVVLKGFFNVIPILIALIVGYLFTLMMGAILPDSGFNLINFDGLKDAKFIVPPEFILPKFKFIHIFSFLIVSFATIAEHLGDTLVLSKVVGRDFYKNPGLNRTIAGDGVATAFASFFGGPPNTTYGENIGVMSISHVYSVWVIGGAAVTAVILSFFGDLSALIATIPAPVMGGVSMMLFGIIASAGIRTIVEAGDDYKDKKNLIISSVILVTGIGGVLLKIPFTIKGEAVDFTLTNVAFATLLGIILNLVLPSSLNKDLEEDKLVHEEEDAASGVVKKKKKFLSFKNKKK